MTSHVYASRLCVLRLVWAVLLALASACTTVPVSKRKFLNLAPDEFVNRLGAEAYAEKKSKELVSEDVPLKSRVERVTGRLAEASGERFPWEVTIFKNQNANAFCLPGGKIGIHDGILPIARSEAGLAFVIGHEMGHAVARHGSERMTQEFAVALLLAAASISMRGLQYRDVLLQSVGLMAHYGAVLPFSRDQELEADRIGLEYMARAGYDPREAPELLKHLAEQGPQIPAILSTHPDPMGRARKLEDWLPLVFPLYEQSDRQPPLSLFPKSDPGAGLLGSGCGKSRGRCVEPGDVRKRSPRQDRKRPAQSAVKSRQ